MNNPIPKNTPEIGVSGGSGRMVMVKLTRRAMKTGVVAELGVAALTEKGLLLSGWVV